MLMPSRVIRTTWSCPEVNFTSIRVSPGSMPIAMIPPLRTLAKSSSGVFFTVPCWVAKNRNPGCCQVVSSLFGPVLASMRIRAAMVSPCFSSSRLAMLRPLAARPMSGISCTRSTYTRPVFVKNIR